MLLACLLFGYWELFSTEFSRTAGHITAAAGFVANILFWREAGYFDTDSALKPTLHLWSLGIEEQFYLVWPPLIALIATVITLKSRAFRFAILALLIVSFLGNLALTWREPAAAFFLPFTRFWELLLGSLLAHLANVRLPTDSGSFQRANDLVQGSAVHNALSFAGLLLIFASMLLLTSRQAFPGWWVLGPSMGAALVIAAGPQAWFNRRLLSLRVCVFFGLISYPLYLWHWPILAFLRIDGDNELTRPVRVAALVASVALAWLTYSFIEKPLRFGPNARRNAVGLASVIAVIGGFAFVAHHASRPSDEREAYVAFFENRPPDYKYGHTHDLFRAGREECNFLDIVTNSVRNQIADDCTTPGSEASVLLWGDSHIQHLAAGMRASLPGSVALLQIATSSCRPTLEQSFDQDLACERSNRFAQETIKRVRPEIVVLAQRSNHLATDWQRLATAIRRLGARSVIVVGPVPKRSTDLYRIIARHYWPDPPEWMGDHLVEEDRLVDNQLKYTYASSLDLHYVSILDLMCRPTDCRAFVGPDKFEDIVTHDYGHFTTSASRWVVERTIAPTVRAILAQQQFSFVPP